MGEQDVVALLAAVQKLAADQETNAKANADLAAEFTRRRGEFRLLSLGVVVIVVIAVCSWLVVRHNDRAEVARKRDVLVGQILSQHDSQVSGCARGNDQRLTLAQIITQSYEPGPPISVPPGFEQLAADSAARALVKRDALLSLPGVQIIDCQAAYPPPDLTGKK